MLVIGGIFGGVSVDGSEALLLALVPEVEVKLHRVQLDAGQGFILRLTLFPRGHNGVACCDRHTPVEIRKTKSRGGGCKDCSSYLSSTSLPPCGSSSLASTFALRASLNSRMPSLKREKGKS